ncbi:hypothetical protein SH1V18_33100 [Vallitalea longa]|uniref:Glycosyltransferase 2-like domain-containing protein n=1 Tax=Vallitalea longa TaxID=2936439 RepID=A0A9W5YE24_9FIRM|nr:glycosyltransferase [Vallitalea longa]GKX30830.1 hypothetical protein SH1V18_33100 [Vallitalea longa]
MPYYSFVILCYNNSGLTKQAVETLIASFDVNVIGKGIEIIVVDNGSVDDTQKVIDELKTVYNKKNIEIINIKLPQNMGYPVGVNMGLSYCRGKIIGVLNNDLIFPKDWLNGIVYLLTSDKKIGFAAPYLSYASGIQSTRVRLNSLEEINKYAENFIKENKDKVTYTSRVIGACIILKRCVLETIGGNDFFYGLGHFDDDDWCLRARLAGYKIAVTGNSFVYHMGSKTFRSIRRNMNHYVTINRSKFHRKWELTTDTQKSSVYVNREKYVDEHNYGREEHFIPYEFDYDVKHETNNKKTNKILLVANWDNIYSRWKDKLLRVLYKLNENEEIYVWIPNNYFHFHQKVNMIRGIIGKKLNQQKVSFMNDSVNHIDLIEFICEYDSVISVNCDFVNKYIVYHANELDMIVI